jgi:hypothetical protein
MDILENKVELLLTKDNWCPYYLNKAISIGTYTSKRTYGSPKTSPFSIEVGDYKKEENLSRETKVIACANTNPSFIYLERERSFISTIKTIPIK